MSPVSQVAACHAHVCVGMSFILPEPTCHADLTHSPQSEHGRHGRVRRRMADSSVCHPRRLPATFEDMPTKTCPQRRGQGARLAARRATIGIRTGERHGSAGNTPRRGSPGRSEASKLPPDIAVPRPCRPCLRQSRGIRRSATAVSAVFASAARHIRRHSTRPRTALTACPRMRAYDSRRAAGAVA